MAFAVRVDFPYGYYQGRDSAGEPELYPTPTRLYSALVAAAFEADVPESSLERILAALAWLEGNPPDAVTLPDVRPSWTQATVAYRKTGLARQGKGTAIDADYAGSGLASRVSCVDGPITYWWDKRPGKAESRMLALLCDEIAYLGERSSVARVEAVDVDEVEEGALPVSKNFLLPDSRAITLDYPEVGRLKELTGAYGRRYPGKGPTLTQDKPKSREDENLAPVPRNCVGAARYLLPHLEVCDAPWTRGFLVPVVGIRPTATDIDPSKFVAWSVALHRSVVKHIGWGAPPMVTGKYAEGIPRPANHMAIQVLPAGLNSGSQLSFGGPVFAVIFPPEATATEIGLVQAALRETRSLYRGKAGQLHLGSPLAFDPTRYWPAPPSGYEYWWTPQPGVVVEIRGDQQGLAGKPLTIADAIKLAVGFVYRDTFSASQLRGLELYNQITSQVTFSGVRVLDAHKLRPRSRKDFVHRHQIPGALTVVSGDIYMEPLGMKTGMVAIGQSRHLGGGLLVPVAVPTGSRQVASEEEP